MATFFSTVLSFGDARGLRTLRAIAILLLGFSLVFAVAHRDERRAAPTPAGVAWMGMPRKRKRRYAPQEASADYGRFSSEMQDETTIEAQQETCQKDAIRLGQAINPRLEYVDRAVSGTKLKRDGLDQLLADAEAGLFNRLFFFSLSRLARESIIGMPILKRLVHVYKIRIISVTEGVDSDREGWEQLAQMCLMQHERYIKELSANTLKGQKSNIKNRFSNGDYCFGYTSTPVPGSEGTRRGRHVRPRMTYAIDPITSIWVKRIFYWFVTERRPIRWITRELNRLNAPKDHRSSTPKWRHSYVARLLANRKYVGDWPWGDMQNVRDPETGLISQEPRTAEEVEQFRRTFADLRLIDDATFATAQLVLLENRETYAHGRNEDGEFVAGREGAPPPASHLLNGLVVCDQPVAEGVCGDVLNVGGSKAKYLFCPGHHQGTCSCQTTLPRRLAETLILGEIGTRILSNPAWLEAVYVAVRTAWTSRQRSLPDELRDTQTALDEVNRKIGRLLDSLEGTDKPDPDVSARLAERRLERRDLETRLAAAQATAVEQTEEPTEEWVRKKLADLGATLASATPAAAYALRDLVGGKILVREILREGKKRHYLRGTFRIRLAGLVTALGIRPVGGMGSEESLYEEITIDFVRENPLDARSEEAKALWDQNLPNKEIAVRLDCNRSMVTKLLQHWSKRHGVELPDGRTRRAQLPPNLDALPLYQRLAEPVMELYRRNLELGDIAAAVGHDRNTVTEAVRFWHESRGLPVPDGRTRRKSLPRSPQAPDNATPDAEPEDPPTT